MKITFIPLFLFTTGLFASEALSQIAKVTVNSSETSYREILNDIENQTDYLFVYDKSDIDLDRKTTIKAQDKPVAEVLSNIFQHTDIIYAMEGNNIMLMKTGNAKPSLAASTPQQTGRRINGIVVDIYGEPVIGANVIVKGTSNGSITDIDGRFNLEVRAEDVLQVTYIGYITQDVRIGNQTTLRIELREDTQALEEIVVIGYGVVKKSDLTGAVASVTANSFKDQPVTRVEDALQGRMAGVEVTSMTGLPGGDVKIRVRGTTSINKGNEPLYVVDGIIRSSGLSGINTADIQSIEVLKDASSTAIYGSRGANGVVLITTRRGQEGKAQITAEVEFGISNMAKNMIFWVHTTMQSCSMR